MCQTGSTHPISRQYEEHGGARCAWARGRCLVGGRRRSGGAGVRGDDRRGGRRDATALEPEGEGLGLEGPDLTHEGVEVALTDHVGPHLLGYLLGGLGGGPDRLAGREAVHLPLAIGAHLGASCYLKELPGREGVVGSLGGLLLGLLGLLGRGGRVPRTALRGGAGGLDVPGDAGDLPAHLPHLVGQLADPAVRLAGGPQGGAADDQGHAEDHQGGDPGPPGHAGVGGGGRDRRGDGAAGARGGGGAGAGQDPLEGRSLRQRDLHHGRPDRRRGGRGGGAGDGGGGGARQGEPHDLRGQRGRPGGPNALGLQGPLDVRVVGVRRSGVGHGDSLDGGQPLRGQEHLDGTVH